MGRVIFIVIIIAIIYGYSSNQVKKKQEEERLRKQEEEKMRKLEEERKRLENERKRLEEENKLKEKLEEIKPIICNLNKNLRHDIGTGYEYLNYKKNEKIRNKYNDIFWEIKPYKEYFNEEYPLVFKFYGEDSFREEYNKFIIEKCKKEYREYFKNIDEKGFGLTEKQLEAVFCDEDATLVNAGAGTGKTKTIESKLLHLVTNKKVPLGDILVMTYSKAAQMDMMKRIVHSLELANIEYNEDLLKNTITTFHAFGKRILDEDNMNNNIGIGKDKSIGQGGVNLSVLKEKEKIRILKESIDNIKSNSIVQRLISIFILYYSSPQVSTEKFDTLSDYYQYTKKTYKTLLKDGEWNITVKSYGEVLIANFLWLHNIRVEYEPRDHYYTTDYGEKKTYRPDFYLPDYEIYIEYFGLDKNGGTAPYIANKEYRKRVDQKIDSHRISGNKLIDIRYADLQDGQDSFLNKLEYELRQYGVPILSKSNSEIIEMKELAGPLEGIAKILNTFLSLYKESNTTLAELKNKVGGFFDQLNLSRNRIFLEIFESFFNEYTSILKRHSYMDFGDMIKKSIDLLSENKIKRKFKYILVDEFQDVSQARASLIKKIISQNNDCRLFCVGDDRQSIYQFAGSDINIFLEFDKYFGYTKEITLDKTFRFNQGISDLSGGFIMMNPDQKEKVLVSNDKTNDGRVIIVQKNNEQEGNFKYFFEILNSIVVDSGGQKEIHVYLITRYKQEKYDDGFFDTLKIKWGNKKHENTTNDKNDKGEHFEFLYGEKTIIVTHLTSHRAKGLEADYVIVDYVNQGGRYDFPSNFEDDPILGIIMNDTSDGYPFAEERRVFYVSMTRGKKQAYLVYTQGKESLFLQDLVKINTEKGHRILKIKANELDTVSILNDINLPGCPDCKGKLQKRKNSETQEEFRGCINYPRCNYIQNINSAHAPYCPKCGARMKVKKNNTSGENFRGCSNYPPCRGRRSIYE